MPDTINHYLEEFGDVSFEQRPMNEVDSLILCQLVYLKFDGMVPGIRENKPSVTLEELALSSDAEKLFADERFEKDNRRLVEGMLKGRRFRHLKLNCYVNVIEKERETQFAAITFLLEDGTIYIAFRGTDETIVGWKEDFNMAFLSQVPGQAFSVKYLNMVTARFPNDFYVGGHSKGGNLAVYSAMNCVPYVQSRILKVYSMDGPGFHPRTLQNCNYEAIADRVIKLMPHSSVIGMIFEWDTEYRVVEARHFGLAQHNPYNWKVKDGEFVTAEDIYERARQKSSIFNEWIMGLDEEHIRLFVDTLYQVISASEAEDLITITADWKRSMLGMVSAVKELDAETSVVLQGIVKELFEIAKAGKKQHRADSVRRIRSKIFGTSYKAAEKNRENRSLPDKGVK